MPVPCICGAPICVATAHEDALAPAVTVWKERLDIFTSIFFCSSVISYHLYIWVRWRHSKWPTRSQKMVGISSVNCSCEKRALCLEYSWCAPTDLCLRYCFICMDLAPSQMAIRYDKAHSLQSWWRHQMETFSALLALCAGTSLFTGEFPSQRPVTRSFDVFFDLCLNKELSKQSKHRRFETPSSSSWRHCNGEITACVLHGLIPKLLCHCLCVLPILVRQFFKCSSAWQQDDLTMAWNSSWY